MCVWGRGENRTWTSGFIEIPPKSRVKVLIKWNIMSWNTIFYYIDSLGINDALQWQLQLTGRLSLIPRIPMTTEVYELPSWPLNISKTSWASSLPHANLQETTTQEQSKFPRRQEPSVHRQLRPLQRWLPGRVWSRRRYPYCCCCCCPSWSSCRPPQPRRRCRWSTGVWSTSRPTSPSTWDRAAARWSSAATRQEASATSRTSTT